LPCRRPDHCMGMQMEVVSGKVSRRMTGRTCSSAACKAGSMTPGAARC
jgi:hypothetical protein